MGSCLSVIKKRQEKEDIKKTDEGGQEQCMNR